MNFRAPPLRSIALSLLLPLAMESAILAQPTKTPLVEDTLRHDVLPDARSFPPRSPQAYKDLVDLTNHFNAHLDSDRLDQPGSSLRELPAGLRIMAQAVFEVRGIVQLAGHNAGAAKFPRAVQGIGFNQSCTVLHFLHGAVGREQEDVRIGEYVVHFANGKVAHFPLIYGRNIRDWFTAKDEPAPTDAEVAWTGRNDAAQALGQNVRLYSYSAMNPYPDTVITAIDFVSAETASAPFLLAISTERNGSGYRKAFRNVRIDNSIVARSPAAGKNLVDLSKYYNTSPDDDWINYPGHDFQDLPKGIQTFAGVQFDVRGMIVLASASSLGSSRVLYPEQITGIPVNQQGRMIHFLQGCGYSDVPGAKLGEYVVHYANGETRVVPIVYGKNVLDWWCKADEPAPTDAVEAWRGQNPSSRGAGRFTHLLKLSWENPLPAVEISSIDFASSFVKAVPFLIAVTIE